jgi:hypothetical protein
MKSKNSFFKRKKYKNTKNLPMSLANEHQQWFCYQQRDNEGNLSTTYLKKHCSFKSGEHIIVDSLPNYELLIPVFGQSKTLLSTVEATLNGITYNIGNYVVLKLQTNNNFPTFLQISYILIGDQTVVCLGHICQSEYFDRHFNSYCVQKTNVVNLFIPAKAEIPWPIVAVVEKSENDIFLSPMCLPDVDEL